MIEKIIIAYLNEITALPKAYMMRPEKAPEKYILVEKTGAKKSNHILHSTFAFQSYAPKLLDAAELNEQVKEAVESMIALDEIIGIRLNSDYNFTNTADKQPRYQAVFDIAHY